METMKNPATASWDLSISDIEFAKLKRGLRAWDMDDKWSFIHMTDEEVLDAETATTTTASEPTVEQPTDEATTDEATTDEATTDEATTDEATTNQEEIEEIDCVREHELMREAMAGIVVDLDQAGNLSIRRSWGNRELYRLAIKPSEGSTSAKIETITWEQDLAPGFHMSEEQAKINTVLLCRSHLEVDFAGFTDSDDLEFSG